MRSFKIVILFFFCLSVSSAYGQYTTEKIHDLRGITDSSGTVHLFYRIFELGESSENHPRSDRNHIYHLNTQTEADSLYLQDRFWVIIFSNGHRQYSEVRVPDYEFPTNDPDQYIYSSLGCSIDCMSSVVTDDSVRLFHRLSSTAPRLVRHPENREILYLASNNETRILEKIDGQWMKDSSIVDSLRLPYGVISIHPDRDSLFFGVKDDALVTSYGDNNYTVVDTTKRWDVDDKVYYGRDSDIIYLQSNTGIYRSLNSGNRGSWNKIYGDSTKIAFESNPSQDRIFVGDGKNLLVSNNRGEEFNKVNAFQYPITSLYQPENRDLVLYVSTKFNIWKLEDGQKVKSLKQVTTSFEDKDANIPSEIELRQNYPNPFNPSTIIRFSLPQSEQVTINVYNTIGQKIKTLINRQMTAGAHSITFNAEGLPSGVYIYQMKAREYSESRKMLLVK